MRSLVLFQAALIFALAPLLHLSFFSSSTLSLVLCLALLRIITVHGREAIVYQSSRNVMLQTLHG